MTKIAKLLKKKKINCQSQVFRKFADVKILTYLEIFDIFLKLF